MARYLVRFLEIEQLEIVVDAKNEDQAIEMAVDQSMDAVSVSVECDYYETEEIT